MKKVFALILCLILVVACFSACGNKEERYMIDEYFGFYHTLGNIEDLDIGIYSVKFFRIVDGKEGTCSAKWLVIESDHSYLRDPSPNDTSTITVSRYKGS